MESESGEQSLQSGVIPFASSVAGSSNRSSLKSHPGEHAPDDGDLVDKTDDVLVAAITPEQSIADLQLSHANSITERIRKNKIRNLTMTAFKNVHPGTWVMKIMFCDKIWRGKDLIVSCSNNNTCSAVLFDIKEMKIVKKFQVTLGVNTFCLVKGTCEIRQFCGWLWMHYRLCIRIDLFHNKPPQAPTAGPGSRPNYNSN
ncbi:unnamed protein product [Nesidiocoris tenuis]|uniref:Uncharacterized protein n=1 Tax=Nesidiocoris tenuis TaxID=355587 RepID=A0A6H5H8M1_9HEMI|nr:unnamed protein product [Nesidiocoris tenuis]